MKEIAKSLNQWFKKSARVLPWRSNPEPYAVWISEIMLQQTQVTTVIPYFGRFMQAFPTVKILAQSDLDQVYRQWAGLGYYSRARNLHLGAQAIAHANGSHSSASIKWPSTKAEWLEIPGVGEYTAGAICSIALNQREPIVDGNVVRVMARLFSIQKLDSKKTKIWELAKEYIETSTADPRNLNQALMELGALVCRPKNPLCDECPVNDFCQGKKSPEKYPDPKPKKEFVQLKEQRWVWIDEAKRHVWLQQNERSRWQKGLWDFSSVVPEIQKAKLMGHFSLSYTVTHHKISRRHTVLNVDLKSKMDKPLPRGKWFHADDLPGVPSVTKKAIEKLLK